MRLDVVAVHALLSELAGMVHGRLVVVVRAEHVARLACGQDALGVSDVGEVDANPHGRP